MLNAVQQSSSSATSHMKKYKKLKYLGKGSYGAAILVELRSNPSQKFVLKEIVIGHMKPAEIEATKKEAEVLHQMNHSNITSYIESFVENSKLHIVMEHADGGDLSAAIAKRRAESRFYEEEEAMRIFVQICFALRHIHKANILHRDLKSQNIFLTSNGMVKLGDFGIAKVLDASEDQARTQIGTPYYLSPEICESKPYGTKSDMWSLGVVLYEILALEMPFQANSLPALVHRIVSSEPSNAKIETRYSSTLVDLLKSLLLKNPDLRPSVNQIVKSDFLKSHISRLLSFTLKSGTGGVSVPPSEQQLRAMDADEAERNLDVARGKAPLSVMDAKQNARDQQLERMRNMRQDMINKQRALQQPSSNSNNNNNRPFSPRSAGNNRALSPKPNRGLSPKRDREKERATPSSNNNNNNANPFARQQNPYEAAPVNTYESVARKEYFANRAAAQAIKAKVEQYERGGAGGGAAAILTAGTNNNFAVNNNNNNNVNSNAGNARRLSENDFATADAESRIAMLKAQKEQEREREIAQKEMQMRQAIEANREERRRLEALAAAAAKDNGVPSRDLERAQSKKAIAFEVNLGDNNPSAHPPRRLSHGSGAGGGDAESGGARVRRGWGPPVDGMEIAQAKGIARGNASFASSAASSAPSSRSRGMMISEDSKPTTPSSSSSSSSAAANDALLGGDNMLILDDDNRQVLQRLESKRKSQLEMKNEAREVLRKLREKKIMQAKGQKPREVRATVVSPVKRVGEAQDDKASGLSPMQARLMEVMSSVETAQESVQNAVRGAGGRGNAPRAEDKDSGKYGRMSAKDKEVKAVRELEERFPLLYVADEKETSGSAAEDELQSSLEHWLEQQKRSVTVRNKKPIQQRGGAGAYPLETLNEEGDLAETVNEAEDLNMYSTASQTLNLHRRDGANNAVNAADDANNEYIHDEFDDFEDDDAAGNSNAGNASRYDVNRPVRGQVMGDDVEVVGMQCMLAKALMGDDADDDDEEEVYVASRK